MRNVPVAVWVLLLAAVFFAAEFVWLRVRHARHGPAGEAARQRLAAFATALHHYARDNLQRLPESLDELNLPGARLIAYRPIPRLNLDEKLILIHDAEPTQKVIEFPVLRNGRGVVFASGRMHIVSEEVFEKLLAADNALRERHQLEPVEPGRSA